MSQDLAYNLATIRKLLHAAFTAEELRRFCWDRPLFRPIVDRFSPRHGLDDMVDEALVYCETELLLAEILLEVQAEKPRQYARFEGDLYHAGAPPAPQEGLTPLHKARGETSTPGFAYLDFDLCIEGSSSGYRARVLSSPAGQAHAEFSPPFSDLELENFDLRLGRTRRGVRRLDSPEMETAKSFGGRLFEALFDEGVQGCLRSSLDEADRQEAGLRIRIRLADAPELANLPWEYLYNSALNRFMCLSRDTPLIRYLELPERIRPLAI